MPEDTNDYEVGYGKPAGYRKMKILNTFLRSISASVNNYIYPWRSPKSGHILSLQNRP